jgi:hypothetical protein
MPTPTGIPPPLPTPSQATPQAQQHLQYPAQASPSINGPRFDNNAHVPPPVPFPFPPPPNFNADFFKQFASAGFPPPPPPNFPPVPIANAGFPQPPTPASASVPSPYPQYRADGPQGSQGGLGPHEQTRQYMPEQYAPSPRDAPVVPQLSQHGQYGGASKPAHNTNNHGSRPAPKAAESEKGRQFANHSNPWLTRDSDQSLPSFGSRSDLNMLFASMQNHAPDVAPQEDPVLPVMPDITPAEEHSPPVEGSASRTFTIPQRFRAKLTRASAYDPTRPATLPERTPSHSSTMRNAPKNIPKQVVERSYENKSIIELRQLAKGAVLSLVPHKILFSDLIKEGVDAGVLRELYAELGVKVALEEAQLDKSDGQQQHVRQNSTQEPAPVITDASREVMMGGTSATDNIPVLAIPAIEASRQHVAPSPSLERKDRIALLLAAKTGRPTPPPAPVLPITQPGTKETPSASQTPPSPEIQLPVQQISNVSKPRAQPEVVKQKMEQLRREALAKKRAQAQASNISTPPIGSAPSLTGSAVAALAQSSAMTSLIPGLFMGSAEAAEQEPTFDSSLLIPSKRPSDGVVIESERDLKRPALSRAENSSGGAADESDGEIIEDQETDTMVVDDQQGELLSGQLHTTATEHSDDQLYMAKQNEIEAMHRKIAEMEQRNKLKRTRSQTDTPVSSGADVAMGNSPIAQPGQLPGSVESPRQFSGPRTKVTPAQLRERAAALKAEMLKQRSQRQEVLQQGLPDLNAEVRKTETRLEVSRNELAQVRAQIQSFHTQLDRLVVRETELSEEILQYEQRLEEGQAGQKQYSEELQHIKDEKMAEGNAVPPPEASSRFPTQEQEYVLPNALSNGDVGAVGEDSAIQADVQADVDVPDAVETAADMDVISQPSDEAPTSYQLQPPTQQAEADAQSPEILEDVHSPEDEDRDADEMEISPEPEAYQETHEIQVSTFTPTQDTPASMDVDDDQSDGSASMSGSDEEEDDYEPAEAEEGQPMQQSDDEGEYDPEEAPVNSAAPTGPADDDFDDYYEPSEPQPLTDTLPTPAELATPGDFVTGGHDTAASPDEDGELHDEPVGISEVPANTADDLDTNVLHQETNAPLQLQPHSIDAHPVSAAPMLNGDSAPSVHFVPYKTPLSSFKTYRFHPEYADAVKTGYRSLTYSNSIDPTRPLCPTEVAGQVCSDTTCEEQHFSQLGLPDDKILVQMSSAAGIADKATKDAFHAGLKQVIADLRTNEVRDFEKVADALSKYRRSFFTKLENEDTEEGEAEAEAIEQDQPAVQDAES